MRVFLAASLVLSVPVSAWAQAWKGVAGDVAVLRVAAEAGDAEAMAELAYHSRYSLGGLAYDEKFILDHARRSAEQGNASGMACLSSCYRMGTGTDFDPELSHRWAEKSAAAGHPDGLRQLGACYMEGYHVKPDSARGIKLYRQAEMLGSLSAKTVLGYLYWKDEDPNLKKQGLERLADASDRFGWRDATADIVSLLENARLEEQEPELFARMLARLEEDLASGHPQSLYIYGHHLRRLGDYDGSLHYIGEAARLGNRDAMGNLVAYMMEFDSIARKYVLRCDNKAVARLGRIAYARGCRTNSALAGAARSFTLGDGLRPADLAKAEELAIEMVRRGRCAAHVDLSYICVRAYETGEESMQKHALAVASALFHSHHGAASAELLGLLLGGGFDGMLCPATLFRLPEAYAAAAYAAEKGSENWKRDNNLAKLKARLSPEELARAEELIAEGYPAAERFRRPAAEVLEKAGRLPPDADPILGNGEDKAEEAPPPEDGGA